MTISSLRNDIQKINKAMADLQKQRSDETKKEAEKSHRISQIQSRTTINISKSARESNEREINRLTQDIASIQKKKAGIEKNLADKTMALSKAQEQLAKEEDKERKKTDDAAKKQQQELGRWQKKLADDLAAQKRLTLTSIGSEYSDLHPPLISRPPVIYDVFISHASEDKEEFVRPLAERLQQIGFKVWYDEFSLKVGDNLRRSIDRGLVNSRYGIVILSSSFFAKEWPQYELDSLVTRELGGHKIILPIWHKVSKDEVLSYSPSLANKLALNSAMYSIEEIARKLSEVLDEH